MKAIALTTFNDLGLIAPLLKALEAEGYTTPTPIQAKAIPVVASGADLLGIAQTGTGKTAAFALPILQRLAADRRPAQRRGCRALVLSPTRELATQIGDSFRTYGRFLDMRVAVVLGGVAHKPQTQALAHGVDVLVATPGRLLDHVGERNLVLSGTEIFVLDEADQMLDLGFVKPIRRIVSMMAGKRQNLFFSATMPHEIGALAAELLVDPQRVEVAPAATTVERILQKVIHVEQSKKRSLLVELLSNEGMARTLVFTRTKRGADRVAEHLEKAGIVAAAIHGNKSQQQRQRALESFRAGKVRVLVATDIAARGIDIDLVSHVVNFELPEVPEQYVHRIGRTGRAGAAGMAIALCDGEERGLLRDIERLTRQTIPSEDRRNDATLAAHAVSPRRADADGRSGERSRSGSGDGRNGSSRNGADHRRDGQRPVARSSGRGDDRRDRHGHAEDRGRDRSGDRNRAVPGGRDRRGARSQDRGDGGITVVGGWSPTFDEYVPVRDEATRSGGERHRGGGRSAEGHGRSGTRADGRDQNRDAGREGGRSKGAAAHGHRGEGRSNGNGHASGPRQGASRGHGEGPARGSRGAERHGQPHGHGPGQARGPRSDSRAAPRGDRPQQGSRRSGDGQRRGDNRA